ncbi:flagellar protein FliS [Sporosarcina sp. ACRSM]|uniref:flagellar export chaperone FliS n=1 Tax=Sporosarcina sp. ACRSM TaxID=2918216 RepID=UPI001EF5CD9B|nr:flagellar protein FliS [Sporosarcina sp. ACRSM]
MDIHRVARRYKENDYTTLSSIEYVLRLIDECQHHVRFCRTAIPSDDRDVLYESSAKAQQLLFELIATVNGRTAEGERLITFYIYLNQCLVGARLQKKAEPLQEVIGHLEEMKNAWEIAKQKSRQQNFQSSWV